MLNKFLLTNDNFKEIFDLIFFLIIYIILYYSVIKDFKLKRQISLLGIFYFSIYNFKYALITIIILFIEQENNNFFEYFSEKNPLTQLTEGAVNAYATAGKAIRNHSQKVKSDYDKSQDEETKETFINMDNITGSMKGMAEFMHNNNSMGKIKENLKCGAQKFIKDSLNFKESKISQEKSEEDDNKSNEDSNDSSQDSEDDNQENFTNMKKKKKLEIKNNKVKIETKNKKPQKLLVEHLNDYHKYDKEFENLKKNVTNDWNIINNDLLKLKKKNELSK